MRQEWIIEVLADLHRFAQKNAMPELAAQVAVTIEVARREALMAVRSMDDVEMGATKH